MSMKNRFWKTIKVSVALLTLGAMVMTAACSRGATKQGTENTGESASATSSGSIADPVTLKVWFPGNEQEIETGIKKIASDFESSHPNIKVEVTTIPWTDYPQKLAVAYAGSIQPDLHGLGFGQLISTVDQGNYLDLAPLAQQDNWSGKDDFFPSIWKAGEWKGGQYGLLIPETRPLVWRKDFFQEAGLDPNKPPQTMDDIFAYAKELALKQDGKVTRAGMDIPTSGGEQAFLSMLLLMGKNIYNDQGDPTFDSPEAIQLLDKMVDLVKDGDVIPSDQLQKSGTPFQNGQAAMAFQSSYSLGQLTAAIGADKIGWTLPPEGPTGLQTSLMLGTFVTISKKTQHPKESWEFMKFLFSSDEMFDFAKTTGFVPPLQSLKDKYEALSEANKVIFESMNDAQGYIPSANWNTITKYLRVGLEEAYYAKKTPEQAMKDNAEKARQEIANK